MTDALNVTVICGSLRKGSYNAALTRALPALAPPGMTITPAPSFREFPIFDQDIQDSSGIPAPVETLAAAMRAADGILIVSPEYNWTIPGGLKNAIDWLSRVKDQPFGGKPVALQSAARGPMGASRMQYHLRQSVASLDAIVLTRPEIFVTFAPQKFDEKTMALKDQPTLDIIKQQLDTFAKFIRRVGKKG
jgi:chromate reductase